MNIFEKAEVIEKQMKTAKVVLSYNEGIMKVGMENASINTYGFIIGEFLADLAESHPRMIPALVSACKTFLESQEVTGHDD